jgi:hypothetical protein
MALSVPNLNKQLRVTFTLGNSNAVFPGAPAGANANVLQLTGLRMSCVAVGGGYPAWPSATLKIYGMAQADMNALAVQQVDYAKVGYLPNTVLVESNAGKGWSAVYAGAIVTAAPDYSTQPDVPLVVTSMWGVYDSVNAATVTSFPSATDLATVLEVIIAKMGQTFINAGVTGQTSSKVYYTSSLTEQLRDVCAHYNLDPSPSADNTSITVTPKGDADSSAPYVLSPQYGLVSNPTPQANGLLSVRALYSPTFHVKSPITIDGSDTVIDNNGVPTTLNSSANGDWFVCSITNTLEALTPNGAWFSDMLLSPPSLAQSVLGSGS